MEDLSDKVTQDLINKFLISDSQELREIFQAIDTDKSNSLTLSEVGGEIISVNICCNHFKQQGRSFLEIHH